jgi:pimeloyl-ACP methyl ester carboxylesterase
MKNQEDGIIRPEFRTIDGLSIRIAKSARQSSPGANALLLNPWPESIYAYEPTWTALAAHAELTAVDLPGFGHSERREALMAPRAMGEFIVRLADELGLDNPHLVGPDIGTSACLFAAAAAPNRFRSVTVGTGGAAVPLQLGGELREWVEAPNVESYRRIGGEAIVNAAIGHLERYKPSLTVLEDYRTAYAGDRFAESLAYVRAYPRELPILRDLLASIRTPVQVINGRRDPVVPLANAEFLVERLPNSRLDVIDHGHFLWEDAADEYAALLLSWWNGGYQNPRERARSWA